MRVNLAIEMRSGRRYGYVAIALAMAVLAVPTQAPAQPPAPPPMAVYSDPKGRFTIEYPAAWRVTTHTVDVGTVFSGVDTVGGSGWVDVASGDFPEPKSSEAFAQSTQAVFRQHQPAYKQLQEGPTTIAGRPAYYFYYTDSNSGFHSYEMRVYLAFTVTRQTAPTTATRAIWLVGGTVNDPRHVRDSFPLILRIIWSLRPA